MSHEIVEMINLLSHKLGIPPHGIWEWAILQVRVEIYKGLLLIPLAFLTMLAQVKLIQQTQESMRTRNPDRPLLLFLVLIWGIITAIVYIKLLQYCFMLPQYIINPEYSAFQIVVEQLSTLR